MTARYAQFGPSLVEAGYDITPVARGGKRPILEAWTKRPEEALQFERHADASIGTLCGGDHNIVAVDVDIMCPFTADAVERLAQEILGYAPKRIGKSPKSLFVYRCDGDAWRKQKTGTYNLPSCKEDAAVEILGEGQQFVASGIHEDTRQPYKWPQDSIANIAAGDLTLVTHEQLHEFLDQSRVTLENAGALKGRVSERKPATQQTLNLKELDGEMKEIETALAYLPNDDEHYDDWVGTLHAIKGALGEDGRDLAHRWSRRSEKYDEAETDRAWNSIKEVRHIGAGSIYHWASQYGFDLKSLRQDGETVLRKEAAKEEITGRILSLSQLSTLPPPMPLVDGLIFQNTLINVFGPPASFKSFLALDIALSVAHSANWHGRDTKGGPVLYIAGEGSSGIRKRATAWLQNNGVEDGGEPFFVLPQAVNIRDVAEVAALIGEIGETLPGDPTLIVIDTLARSFGGGDENSGEAMGEFIAGCDEIRNAFDGAAVMVIHHAGKDTSRGARGHSSLFGAVDTELALKRNQGSDTVSIRNSKQKDAEESETIRLTARVVPLPPSGPLSLEEESSIVLDDAEGGEERERRMPKGANQRAVYRQIQRALDEVGKPELVDGKTRTVITASAAKTYAYMVIEKGDGKDRRHEVFKRATDAMRENEIIGFYNDYYWVI